MESDEISCSENQTKVPEPGEPKNSSIERKDRELDDAYTPSIDEDVCKCDLVYVSAIKM